ncbi:AEC family transporter [Alicyclobacillus sendaiensis]|uniref:AEC family transporter n=1 Tax=Alicyclobacillus sendaiensis TaxID=192387 RepID=UPI0026F41E26|nr:AEC family transporter [Alicyclobacillus sendaiensis]
MNFLHLLWTITVPILLICVAGALVARYQEVETRSLSTVALYLLAPALILSALPSANLRGDHVVQIVEFTALITAVCWLVAWMAGRVFRLDRATSRALVLTTIFSNSNNYGLPVLLLAFGIQGFALGTIYVILQILLVNTLGVSIAASGRAGGSGLKALYQSPLLYASALGVVLSLVHHPLPGGFATAAKLLGDAYAAVVLLILGVQLGRTRWSAAARKSVWIGVILRVVIVPVAAKLLLMALGIRGLLAAVLFVEASMPAAVNTVALASRYEVAEEWTSMVVAVTTALSFVYLPFLIAVSR